ncbi:hypothetical protein JK365_15550 [Salmonella enterica subsp. enterica serovar Ceyco]|uniref:SinI family autotransporter-associated protein n=1 Tax=Salmonella enterica TaxID=28901 RepID=UPI001923778C|nr:SinI family autotransporter-associated protein [Salmonella enterica]EEJ7232245.1 hypothetical protein [Salmonella enterica subsp. salamae]MBL1253878.1 hypothetical protein [Salmonella enterica subsp. enterica serovar Ceyco]MCB7130785.1 hypothetical protein [Salmonella enterica subsp. enterica serovar Hillegersberg]HAV1236345.1 hypothetical protein [Salmonella enterica]
MKQETRRGLTKIALALALAGYCAVPAVAANESGNLKTGQWVVLTESTGQLQGTKPGIISEASTGEKDHVKVTVDRHGRAATTEAEKQLHVGDTLTVSWAIDDTEGDVDNGTNNTGAANALTTATIQWIRSDTDVVDSSTIDISGAVGQVSYTITDADASKYLGISITPTTSTGIPNVGDVLKIADLSSQSDSDDVPDGPVVDEKLKVSIYKDGETTNLLGGSTPITLNTTYKVLLWSDRDGNGTYSADENVTDKYNYRWKLTGQSKQLNTSGGIINESHNNQPLVVPQTNAEAKTSFDGSGLTLSADGVQGYGLSIDYQAK